MGELANITIAALLHDIGKVFQRADKKINNDFNFNYCPTFEGRKSHIHAAHTGEFLSKYFDIKDFKKEFFVYGKDGFNIVNLAASHHNPSTKYDWIIAAADRLASGFERTSFEKYSMEDWEAKQQENFRKSRLISVFSQISLKGEHSKSLYFYNLKRLNPNICPVTLNELTVKEAKEEYRQLTDNFEKDFKKFFSADTHSNFEDFLNGLISFLEIYLWCVPSSSYKTLADVSLFDHLKTTAAISNCLYIYHEDKNGDNFTVDEVKEFDSDEEKFILVKGDFSGIQNFIFSKFGESNKYAAKILRAKSFYVSIFTDSVAYLLCKEFNVNSANVIVSAGGHFLILLPNLKNSKEKIEVFFKEVSGYLEDLTYGQTTFNYSYEFVSGRDFSTRSISKKMDSLNLKLQVNKLKRTPKTHIFKNYLEDVQISGGVCNIDGYSPKSPNSEFSLFSNHMIKLGEKLPKNNYLTLHFGNIGEIKNDHPIPVLEMDNKKVSFTLNNRPYFAKSALNFTLDTFNGYGVKRIAHYVPLFTDEDLKSSKYTEIPENVFDQSDFEKGKIKSFYHIAVDSKEEKVENGKTKYKGKPFLGILKADVDNLGLIFSKGFERESISFAKIVSLSRMFDFFFTGWLPQVIKERYPSIYTVFAGGDDLFLIGPYTEICMIAKEIYQHFKDYVKNDEIHLSAGIVLRKPNVPVYQMADSAEEELEKAKAKGKNRVSMFDCVVKWDRYIELIEDIKTTIDSYFEKYNMSTSYAYKILRFIEMKNVIDEAINEKGYITLNEIENAKWIALLTYSTKRNFRNNAEDILTKMKNYIDEFGRDLLIPISLTLYERRN